MIRIQNHVAHGVGQGDFRGRDQVQLARVLISAFGYPEHILFEFRQLSRAVQAVGVGHIRRVAFGVAVLRCVGVQHQLRQCAVQTRQTAAHETETRASQFTGHIKVQQAEVFAQCNVVFHLKIKFRRVAPARDLLIIRLIRTDRHGFVRQIRQIQQQSAHLCLDAVQLLGRGFQFIANPRHLRHDVRCIELLRFAHADFFGQFIALRLQLLGFHLNRFTLRFESVKRLRVQLKTARF